MQHSEMGRLKNPHNGPYSPLHICSITKAPALVRLPKTTWIRISWVILRNCLPSFSETNWFYIQSLEGGSKNKNKNPISFGISVAKGVREKDGSATSLIHQEQQKQHKVRALQPWRPVLLCKAQEPGWSDSMCFLCQHHGKGSVLQCPALISKASGDILMGSEPFPSSQDLTYLEPRLRCDFWREGLRSRLSAERGGVTFFTLAKCSFLPEISSTSFFWIWRWL